MADEDWKGSSTADLRWAARRTVLDTMASMGCVLDVLDPEGCRRHNRDEGGNPLHGDESMGICELVHEWQRRLGRVNGILRELEGRERDRARREWMEAQHADSAALPDSQGR